MMNTVEPVENKLENLGVKGTDILLLWSSGENRHTLYKVLRVTYGFWYLL